MKTPSDKTAAAIALIKALPDRTTTLGRPAGEETIASAEKELGVKFPPSYRVFLKEMGLASFWGTEILGISEGSKFDKYPDVVWCTKAQRGLGMEKSIVPLSPVGDGDWYVIDLSEKDPDGEAAVFLKSAHGNEMDRIAGSFGDFLHSRASNAVEKSTEKAEHLEYFPPPSEQAIAEAEKALDIGFPASLKNYLRRVGRIRVGARLFGGLCRREEPDWARCDIVKRTEELRSRFGLSKTIIWVGDDEGGFFALDIGQPGTASEAGVWRFDAAGKKSGDRPVYGGFSDFWKTEARRPAAGARPEAPGPGR